VKFSGASEGAENEINDLLKYLSKDMREGKIYYKYIDSLHINSDCMSIKTAYENFVNTGHIDILKTNISESELVGAMKEIENLLHKYKKNLTDTIQKNIMVKLLYWLCENFSDIKIDGDRNIKVVAKNIDKESEIYFFVFLNLLGMDVCLLQYSKDTDILKDYFYTKRIGDYIEDKLVLKPYEIPESTKSKDIKKEIQVVQNEEGRVRISLASIRRKDRDNKEIKTEASAANSHISNTGGAAKTAVSSADTNMPRSGIKTDRELSYIELAKLSTSIVMIAVYDNRQKMLGTGSGIMIGKDGFILTNNHVIRGGYYFEVRIEDDERIYKTDEVIKYNQYLDLAIIRIPRVLSPLRLFDGREKLVRGQNVVAIGSPLGLFNSVSDGIISGFRNIDNVDMIQFSAPISPGSSGGAVLNMFGEVIGISTAGFSEGQNINLAVPYDAIYGFAKSFIR
ncbi:MAG: trypsin-like peptidase domain-containing protein, partial [Lachnoanaerobaculum sp.]|nr:trypsin-like peptidase domain-containing protein [Lachnoanaerobaculum sp.]